MFCRSLFVVSGLRVTRSLVLYVGFVDRCLFLVPKDRVTRSPLKTNNDLQNLHIKLKME
jgi:hypothetical protein